MRWLRRDRFRFFRGQRGFSLIEVLVAVAILTSIGVVSLRALDANARAGRVLDEQVQATNLVTAYLEAIRQLDYSDNASPYNSVNATITKPTQYDVGLVILYGYLVDGVLNWATDNNSGEYKLQKITISVSRTDGKLVLTTCTFRTKR